MRQWHTVRFVDEPEPPHDGIMQDFWKERRGRPVRVRMHVFDGSEYIARPELMCDCDQWFEVDEPSLHGGNGVVCRRMLEMD